MLASLRAVRAALSLVGQLPEIGAPGAAPGFASWREFWGSEQWARVVEAHGRLSDRGFATLAPQAVGVALLALALNWRRPQQAVALAAAMGGNASTTAALTGARWFGCSLFASLAPPWVCLASSLLPVPPAAVCWWHGSRPSARRPCPLPRA
jgi:hypothetical protein